MTNQSENNSSEKSASRSSYPYCSWAKTLTVADAVRDLGGNKSPVHRGLLAAHFKVEESSTGFSQLISAARCFGLIEGRIAFVLTDLAKQYYFPTDEFQRRRAELELIASPPAYRKLLQRFDGNKLPNTDMLANLLLREMEVPESWKVRIASMFLNSLKEIEVVDAMGILRYGAALSSGSRPNFKVTDPNGVSDNPRTEESSSKIEVEKITGSSDTTRKDRREESLPGMNAWVFRYKGSTVRLETSDDLPLEAWNKLLQYVQVLKPPGQE